MKSGYLLLVAASLAMLSCKDDPAAADSSAAATKKKGSALSGLSPDSGDDAKRGEGKSTARPKIDKKAAVAEPAKGEAGKVISPNTGALVDVAGRAPGELVDDPKYPGDESKRFVVPEGVEKPPFPVAQGVPGKPGFAFSPYNNQIIDLRGMPPGSLVADPTFPASEKKHFRVPGDLRPAELDPSKSNVPLITPEGDIIDPNKLDE